ncbi:MAG: hypothetical protein K2W82_09490 [Candidatus Obscuribacterales bacterium]|nr:hypothetical protein [Candidatus Obscuribacterales bacterium]
MRYAILSIAITVFGSVVFADEQSVPLEGAVSQESDKYTLMPMNPKEDVSNLKPGDYIVSWAGSEFVQIRFDPAFPWDPRYPDMYHLSGGLDPAVSARWPGPKNGASPITRIEDRGDKTYFYARNDEQGPRGWIDKKYFARRADGAFCYHYKFDYSNLPASWRPK